MIRRIIRWPVAVAVAVAATAVVGACSPVAKSSAPNMARTEPAIDAVEDAASTSVHAAPASRMTMEVERPPAPDAAVNPAPTEPLIDVLNIAASAPARDVVPNFPDAKVPH